MTPTSAPLRTSPRPASSAGPQAQLATSDTVDLAALADLVTAPTDELAESARAVLAPVLPHRALVLVSPAASGMPVRISAPHELRERLAAIDWLGIAASAIPSDDGASRVAVPDGIAGLRAAGWAASSAGSGVVLIVGAEHRLEIDAAQDWAARQVATLAAARQRGMGDDPSPGTLAFSHTIAHERDRVRWELASRHAATLTTLLKALRDVSHNGSRATPPGVAMAIDLTSQALLELKASAKRNDAALYAGLATAFAEAETELRNIVRASGLQLITGLEGPDDGTLPRAIARAARVISCAAALNAAQHSGADKLRVHWRLTDDSLVITVADNGDGLNGNEDAMRREALELCRRVTGLGGTVELDSAPRWGSAMSCMLPLRSLPLAPETPGAESFSQLRAREREVLELMVAGMRNRDIAERLFITVRTVKFHVSNILRKLDVQSRAEVIVLAHSAGISAPEEISSGT
jgi:DNA-binding CsgD family transcriptional regulator/signal transduction histidine kinase